MHRFIESLSFAVFLYGFAGWIYIAENAVFHPETLSLPLTHLAPWPREDTFGAACFAFSFVALIAYLMIRRK